jgi:hypothetical protein
MGLPVPFENVGILIPEFLPAELSMDDIFLVFYST